MGGRQHTSIAQPSCQQPQSWRPSWQFSPSAPTRSSLTSSSTTNPRPQRAEELARVDEDGTKMSAWASEHQRPPLRVLTSTRNALSPVWSPSEAVSSPAPSSLPRCTEPRSSAENTFTSSPNMPDTRRDIKTSLLTSLLLSVSKKVTKSLLVNADLSARLSDSTSSVCCQEPERLSSLSRNSRFAKGWMRSEKRNAKNWVARFGLSTKHERHSASCVMVMGRDLRRQLNEAQIEIQTAEKSTITKFPQHFRVETDDLSTHLIHLV